MSNVGTHSDGRGGWGPYGAGMETIGPALFERKPEGGYVSAIGTVFPRHRMLVTAPPLHLLQRGEFMELLKARLELAGEAAWPARKLHWESTESVDLVLEPGDVVLIRPELERLDLAFETDRLLQDECGVPKHRIRFARTQDRRVRQALRERGELWRMFAPISGRTAAIDAIRAARVGIAERPIYYYNAHSGTRWLTCHEFAALRDLADAALARQLEEIRVHSTQRNRHRNPEIAFFGADPLQFGAPAFNGPSFIGLAPEVMRARFDELARAFLAATPKEYQVDDLEQDPWRGLMVASITAAAVPEGHDGREEISLSSSVEAILKVRWLPGGRFDQGAFTYESFLPSTERPPEDPELQPFWDPLARGFIANFIREHGDIEYLNLGRVELNAVAPGARQGRRGVYLAELKVRGEHQPRVLFLRLQRWGIAERLAEVDDQNRPSKDLVQAILDTEEYVDYTLDRRLGCLQFGLHLPARVHMRRLTEIYRGCRSEYREVRIPVIYFEREYLPGIPSNRISARKLEDPRYAEQLARLLGKAAAPNLVVGRTLEPLAEDVPGEPLFDNGDEIVVDGSDGLPRSLVLVDHSGAFADWRTPTLLPFAQSYAGPANRRLDMVADPRTFADQYLAAFRDELQRIRADYTARRAAFDGLFKHLPVDPKGSLAWRWSRILVRLETTDLEEVVAEVRRHIATLR